MSIANRALSEPDSNASRGPVKVLVWDLDNTLWRGTLAEGDRVTLREGAREVIETLDERGILLSIASKNDYEDAMRKLKEFELEQYFLYPQIGWNAKSSGIGQIAERLNIGLDAVAFVDDEPFERAEVQHCYPQVRVLTAAEMPGLTERPEFFPRFITDESAIRRQMYMQDMERDRIEAEHVGPQVEFLAGLEMKLSIDRAREEDLQRAEELTVRTNQLNTTGYTYSYAELDRLRDSPEHLLLICGLEDRFGSYGKIGLILVEKRPDVWTLKLLLMSCRVMSRGIGSIVINHLMERAREAGVRLVAEFRANGRNRVMLVTYRFAGFKPVSDRDGVVLLEGDLERIQPHPTYVQLRVGR